MSKLGKLAKPNCDLMLVAVLCIVCSLVIVISLTRVAVQSEYELVTARLTEMRAGIEQRLYSYMSPTIALKAFVIAHNGHIDQDHFESFAANLHEQLPGLLAVQIAPDGIVRFTSLMEKNAGAIGHDLFEDPARREQAYRAIQENRTILAGPVELIQGGNAVIARKPIFIEGMQSRSGIPDFYGFATVLIDTTALLGDIGSRLDRFAIRGRHALGEDGDVFWGPPEIFDTPHVAVPVLVPNGRWVIAAPKPNWTTAMETIVLSSLVCLVVTVAVLRLVCKRRSATLQAIAERQKLEFVANVGTIGFIEIDASGDRSMSATTREILGAESDSLGTLLPDPVERCIAEIIFALDSGRQDSRWEVRIGNAASGGQRTCELVGVRSEGSRTMIVVRDISDAVHRREGEIQTAKLVGIGQMAAGIAHELNTPLQYLDHNISYADDVLTEFAESMTENNATEASGPQASVAEEVATEVRSAIAECREGVSHMNRIVSALRSYSGTRGDAAPEHVDLGDIVERSLVLTTNAHKHLAVVNCRLPDQPLHVWGDRNEYLQVIINSISNACDAIEERYREEGIELPGHIEIDVEEDGDHCVMRIGDDGCGIPPDVQDRVFDLFFTTKSVGKGTGQGLSIALAIVRKYGGDLAFQHDRPVGTAVEIRLPKNPPDNAIQV